MLDLKSLLNKLTFRRLKFYFLFLILIYFILPFRFAPKYDYIPDEEIKYHLVPSRMPDTTSCPLVAIESNERRDVNLVNDYNQSAYANIFGIKSGGRWEPVLCNYVHDVAVIVPYRGREKQLQFFLHHIHPFLQRQLINYRIFIIEQTFTKDFNRGMLMNIGYAEAMKIHKFHCFIFHDVDLLPLVDRNVYGCTLQPRHLSSAINVWRFKLKYRTAFGGVVAILQEQFQKINGFSNVYFGWGGEDDDLIERVLSNDLGYCRFSPDVSRYYMIHHKPEIVNPKRMSLLREGPERHLTDGLNHLNYKVLKNHNKSLYTHIIVDI